IPLGVALPHRSSEPIDMTAVRHVAQRAEALSFRELWVTENTLDNVFCFDPVVVLTYAAAVTTTIRLGASVVVMAVHSPLMIAHQWACLDHASNGRAILGVGLGREHHYRQFEVPEEGRLTRPPSACSWRWMNARRWRGPSSTAGSPRCTTTPRGSTPRASMARRSRCASDWRSWLGWAPTTSYSTPSPDTPSSSKRWLRSS